MTQTTSFENECSGGWSGVDVKLMMKRSEVENGMCRVSVEVPNWMKSEVFMLNYLNFD